MIQYLFSTMYEAESFRAVSQKCPKGRITTIEEAKIGEDDILVNIGYVASKGIPVGALVEPICVAKYGESEVVRIDSLFPIERRACFSSDKIVKRPCVPYRSIYDADLFELAQKKYKKLYSIKIVSNHIGEEEELPDVWKVVAGYLTEYLKDE